jgi:uncharacterized protein
MNAAISLPRNAVLSIALGALVGFSLSRIGFTDYTELHRMLTFVDLRMMFVFAGAVAVAGALLFALRKARPLPPRPFQKRVVVGGVLFGIGWAIAGTCPGAAFAQLGEGKVWAFATLFGVALGTSVADRVLAARPSAPDSAADVCA